MRGTGTTRFESRPGARRAGEDWAAATCRRPTEAGPAWPDPPRPARQGRRRRASRSAVWARSPAPPPRRPAASGKFTGTLRVLTRSASSSRSGHRQAGLEGPRIHRQADPGAELRQAAADRDHVARHVRRLRRLQLPVAPGRGPPASLQPVDTHQIPTWGSQYKLFTLRQAEPGLEGRAPTARGTRRSARRSSTPTARPGSRRTPTAPAEQQADRPLDRRGRQADRRQAAAALDRRLRPRTSTPTRWATTPT